MKGRKLVVPKRADVPKKRPKKKPAADAIEFRYERGKETICTTPRKSAKS